jgi:hypothetical protein
VSAHGHRSGFLRDISDTDYVVVRVVEPSFVITHADEKYIEVENTSAHNLDLSGYTLGVGSTHFRIPSGTIVLPHTKVRFPKNTTKLAVRSDMTAGIFYPDDTLALTYRAVVPEQTQVASAQQVSTVATQSNTQHVPVSTQKTTDTSSKAAEVATTFDLGLPELTTVAEAHAAYDSAAGGSADNNLLWWLLGLMAAVCTAVVAVLLIRHEQEEIIKGYEVIEDE